MSFTQWLADSTDWIEKHTNPFAGLFGPSTNEREKAAAQGRAPEVVKGPLTPGAEAALSGIRWAYNNVISRPLTTSMLMVDKVTESPGAAFEGAEWRTSWRAAQNISPWQAVLYNPLDPRGPEARARELEAAPLEYKRPERLPEGFGDLPWEQQQELLRQAGMPVQGNAAVEAARRGSALYKYGTGIGDFSLNWFLDPVVLAGKGVGAARQAVVVRQVQPTWTGARIDQEMLRSPMANAQRFIFANRDNPALLNNLSMAKSSALGPRFGAIASTLRTEEEVNLFLRVGIGDVRAMDQLIARNSLAARMIEQDTSRLPALELQRSQYVGNPTLQSFVDAQIAHVSQRISDNTDMIARYEGLVGTLDEQGARIGGIAHQIDQINLTRWSFARAEAITEAQRAYVAGPARAGGAGRPRTFVAQRSIGTPGRPMDIKVYDPTPPGEALVKQRLFTNFFGTGLTMVRSLGEYRPRGHVNVQSVDRDSVNELRGFLARIPAIRPETREELLNTYLRSGTEAERVDAIDNFQRLALQRIASKYGLSADEGAELFEQHSRRLAAERARMQEQYSTALLPEDPTRAAQGLPRLAVDAFEPTGGGVKIHPNLVTRLINSRQMVDLDHYDDVLRRHSGALQALKQVSGSTAEWMDRAADFFTTTWKFGTLFRLGYIPRVLGDDLGGQIARLGAATMALRAGWGIKNAATNVARAYARPALEAREAVSREGIRYVDEELATITPRIKALEAQLGGQAKIRSNELAKAEARFLAAQARVNNLPANATPAKVAAAQTLLRQRELAYQQAQARLHATSPGKMVSLNTLRQQEGHLLRFKALNEKAIEDSIAARQKVTQGQAPTQILPGFEVPGALSGQRGQFYQTLISSDTSLSNVFDSNKKLVQGNLMNSWDHGAVVVSAIRNEDLHMRSWLHVLNAQFGNDPLARRILAGDSIEDAARWLASPGAGQVYMKRLGEAHTTPRDAAERAFYDVHEIAPDPMVQMKILTPEGIDAGFLKERFPDPRTRPDVHTAATGANLAGTNDFMSGVSRVMDAFFKYAASIPADRMSRHPLFNQLYVGHAKRIAQFETAQGRRLTTVTDANRVAEQARSLALRDTRRLVFDIAHRTDAAAALRYIAPFFSATTEGWQRWARIIADRPEVVGYAAKVFNVPLALGVVQDADGNAVDDEGYAYDPVTQKRYLVKKGDRHIVTRLPKILVEGRNPVGIALGADPSGRINLSQDSMNLVLQGDPWFNPGQGPIVTIPVSEFVKDKPEAAEVARELGILPFGPSTSAAFGGNFLGRAIDQAAPRTVKNFLTAFDTSDDRYQRVKLHVMQQAAFEAANFGKPMPNAEEIATRTRNYWLFSAASAFLAPVAGQAQDPYQFYRDQYNKFRRMEQQERDAKPGKRPAMSADDRFLQTYGESFFVFAQAQTKNVSGLPATKKAVQLSQQYAEQIAQFPELAALLIGPEGNGPFSPEAYAYQLNTPLIPGGAEMQRVRYTAEEAMQENQRRLGWAKFTAKMNDLNAQLFSRGLRTFEDPGAEDLLRKKRGFTALYSKPLFPDGAENPHYIEAWAKDYNTLDSQKYNALIPQLTAIARSPMAQDPLRSDLRILQEYLGARQALNGLLAARQRAGGAATLTARKNADLRQRWLTTVQSLVEANTSFGDLYHRYLSRDMGVDLEQEMEAAGGGTEQQ